VARGLLRKILGIYLNTKPDRLRFSYGKHGKPSIISGSGKEKLKFNLAHSDGLALYAFTCGRHIGIDIERIRVDFDHEQLAAQFFSPQENAMLRCLPAHMKTEAFFSCWTLKEAYIKAKGDGLSLPLNQFDVSLVPGEPATLLNYRGDPQEASRWSLKQLRAGPGYTAALAVEGHGWRLACWQWPE
jgi:4'-phosphopantetheinyl transferase